MGNTTWITNAIQDAIATSIQEWLNHHPTIAWILAHPLGSLAIALFLMFLLWGLLQAIARLAEQVWVVAFRFPLQILGWVLSKLLALVQGRSLEAPPPPPATEQRHQRVDHLLHRLDAVQKEQDALVQEIRTLLRSNPEAIAPPQPRDAR